MRTYHDDYTVHPSSEFHAIQPRFRDERDEATKRREQRQARANASRQRAKARAAKFFARGGA